ncbi:alpha/beta fold hydrolase [Sphingosinicella rhizophila]|uniref:Alpha/beta hydrolase n=1 Tax=Sphingosinicella rhizophila TaxID=3050082 RepID=A0ABU3Q9K3_9SPHN|nr:alpha/beta hydrolase [Sphingosinicella sp. GR2756]MDT9600090.1 alpha/beta hydrolase [Sphingosinicella sp. GR2756]
MRTEDVWIDAPQGRLFARVWRPSDGEAGSPPIILFHDSLGAVSLWRDFPGQLAEAAGRTVIAYDRLGYGRSDPNPHRPGAGFIREEGRISLPALRARLDVDRMILFGHSVGGGMAVAAAAAFPDDVLGVVTESAQAFVEDRTLAGIRDAQKAFADPAQMERLARHHGDKAPWVLAAWTGTWLDEAWQDWSLEAELRRLQCPILAIHGDKDEFGSELHPERIVSQVPAPGEMLLIQDCGHVPHREKADLVLAAVTAFVGRL